MQDGKKHEWLLRHRGQRRRAIEKTTAVAAVDVRAFHREKRGTSGGE
jgi:hypothetical protein